MRTRRLHVSTCSRITRFGTVITTSRGSGRRSAVSSNRKRRSSHAGEGRLLLRDRRRRAQRPFHALVVRKQHRDAEGLLRLEARSERLAVIVLERPRASGLDREGIVVRAPRVAFSSWNGEVDRRNRRGTLAAGLRD